ncbi:hypothetical protein KH5_12110 [Urechidicola sp. KH5]
MIVLFIAPCESQNNKEIDSVQSEFKLFMSSQTFEKYKVEIYKGELLDPDFSTNKKAKRFITQIKNECEKGINFAGKYTLVLWGCGSSCQYSMVIDRLTGKIYDGIMTSFGLEFKKDSTLIITNIGAIDPETNMIETCSYCNVTHELWIGNKFKRLNKTQ